MKCPEVLSSIMTKLEKAKNIHLKMGKIISFKNPPEIFVFYSLSKQREKVGDEHCIDYKKSPGCLQCKKNHIFIGMSFGI